MRAKGQVRRLVDQPSTKLYLGLGALLAGRSPKSPLTKGERLLVGLLSCPPSHLLTIHGPSDGPDMARVWPLMKSRLNRARTNPRPFIYFGTKAQGLGGGGEHLHLLLWDYLFVHSLHRQARELGLGRPSIQRVTTNPGDPFEVIHRARPIQYVLGQHQPLFESQDHLRHLPRAKGQRRWFYPQRSTLAREKPELLSALDAAQSKAVSDLELASRLPNFISNKTTESKVPDVRVPVSA